MKTVLSAAVASNALFIDTPHPNDSTPPFATVCCFRNNKVEINRPPARQLEIRPSRGPGRLRRSLCPACAPPAPGAALLGQRARGVVSFPLRTSHGRGV